MSDPVGMSAFRYLPEGVSPSDTMGENPRWSRPMSPRHREQEAAERRPREREQVTLPRPKNGGGGGRA